MKLRQGSILSRTVRDQLGLSTFKDNPDPVLVVISHSCDLVKTSETEPYVELLHGQRKDEMNGSLANGKNPRTLHLEYEQNGSKKVLELCAFNKFAVEKKMLIGIDPDPDAILTAKDINTLQVWLAARYKRAAFPDGLNSRMQPIKKKLSSAEPSAVIGTWMRYEPEDNHLPDEVPYELWVKVVYSTEEYDAKTKAERYANELRLSFEKNFFNHGKSLWHSIELRSCDAVADTVFSIRDILVYKQWRLEYLSLKQDPPGECI
ncbi:MAG: hypothetical protein ACLPXT_01685 [Terracidiphilus sp.]